LAFSLIVNGDTNALGTSFDAQPFYSNTHSYSTSAGTESNIVSGTGTTISQLEEDIISVMSRFNSFTYEQSKNASAPNRKLNRSGANRMFILCPTALDGVFFNLRHKAFFGDSDNVVRNIFEYESNPNLTNPNNWYAFLTDDRIFKPFLFQKEINPRLDLPKMSDESVKNNQQLRWGGHMRMNVAYGSWWKSIKVTN
jgi:hypothetical protein